MNVTHKIYIDLTSRGETPSIDVVQEEKYSRTIELGLREGLSLWCPPEDTAVIVRYRKPDGTGGEYDTLPDGTSACSISGNRVRVVLAPQVLTAEGTVELSVTLISGNQELTAYQGKLKVSGKIPLSETSEDYFNITGFIPQPETAAVGQYLEISGVDEQGKIRAVRAVEAPASSGSGDLPENVVTCDLTGATEDESAVPVNADTLGGYPAADYVRHGAVMATLQTSMGTVSGSVKMGLAPLTAVGSAFEAADGGIRCLAEGYLLVSASIYFDSCPSGQLRTVRIVDHNGNDLCEQGTTFYGTYGCLPMAAKIVHVNAGDVLYLWLDCSSVELTPSSQTQMTLVYI